jgi:methionyl-tRNA formyltransferase
LALQLLGVVGLHPAALPANTRRHPLIWALVLGLQDTAWTFFFMDAEADSGNILSQRNIPIDDDDYARILYNKIQTQEFLQLLESRSFPRIPQKSLVQYLV